MLFEFNRFSGILFVFFINGLIFSLLLWRKAAINETRSDKWLGIFLLLCTLYLAPWMLGFAGWYDNQPYRDTLFYFPFQHLFLIGPVIYFYTQSLLNRSFRFTKRAFLHLIPGILYIAYSLVMFLTDKVILKDYYFLANGEDPDFDTWYQLTGLLSMFVYLLLSLRYYISYRKLIVQVVSYADAVMFRWINRFLLAFLLMLTIRSGFYITSLFKDLDYWATWWYFLAFGIITYYIALTGYANSIEAKISFGLEFLNGSSPRMLLYADDKAVNDEQIIEAEVIEIETAAQPDNVQVEKNEEVDSFGQKIYELIVTGRLYEDPDLSLTVVARQLNAPPAYVSRAINQGFRLNFNDFINNFRVEVVRQKIAAGEHIRQTLLSIAFECGFNSKATFNRAFKKSTGLSPREYINSMKNPSV